MKSFYITAIGTIVLAALQPVLLTTSEAAAASPSPSVPPPATQAAQTPQSAPATPAPEPAASSPNKRLPRQTTAVEASQNAAPPGELRPENPVLPQISVPIGRKRDTAAPSLGSAATAAAGGIDDELARCQALTSRVARAECRSTIARPAAKPAATSAAPNRPMQGATR